MLAFNLEDTTQGTTQDGITVVGIGGAGANVLDRLALDGLTGAELITMNCDVRALNGAMTDHKIQLGRNLTQGLGCGGDPELGMEAAMSSADEIRTALRGRKIVFVCSGLGGGTGSGAAPLVARLAREAGAFVVVFATMPFGFEGKRRTRQAELALLELHKHANALVTFENDRMGELILAKKGITEAFEIADQVIGQSIRAITGIVNRRGLIRIGMDDLIAALRNADSRCLFGHGIARGENRALEAVSQVLKSPLLDKGQMLDKAGNVLVHVCGGTDMTLFEIQTLMSELQRHLGEDAHIFFGAACDETLGDQISVTLITSLARSGRQPITSSEAETTPATPSLIATALQGRAQPGAAAPSVAPVATLQSAMPAFAPPAPASSAALPLPPTTPPTEAPSVAPAATAPSTVVTQKGKTMTSTANVPTIRLDARLLADLTAPVAVPSPISPAALAAVAAATQVAQPAVVKAPPAESPAAPIAGPKAAPAATITPLVKTQLIPASPNIATHPAVPAAQPPADLTPSEIDLFGETPPAHPPRTRQRIPLQDIAPSFIAPAPAVGNGREDTVPDADALASMLRDNQPSPLTRAAEAIETRTAPVPAPVASIVPAPPLAIDDVELPPADEESTAPASQEIPHRKIDLKHILAQRQQATGPFQRAAAPAENFKGNTAVVPQPTKNERAPLASATIAVPVRPIALPASPSRSQEQQTFDERLDRQASGRFEHAAPTVEDDEDLDVPTFLRRKR